VLLEPFIGGLDRIHHCARLGPLFDVELGRDQLLHQRVRLIRLLGGQKDLQRFIL
jgi:hypothetical protein